MYKKPFYLETKSWNNAFSFERRNNKKLYVPSLKEINNFSEIKLWNKVVFEDCDFSAKLQSCFGLENFYKINKKFHSNPLQMGNGITASIYLFDNHNHAYYFWYLARKEGFIRDGSTLIHIDEHADTRDNWEYLLKPDSLNLEKVFKFTNFELNVGNYIVPAMKEGLIKKVIQIRNEMNLNDYINNKFNLYLYIILNLDLDFFRQELDFISYDLKKKVILDVAKKAKIITIATSPFFINQDLVIKIFKDIFS